MSYATLLAEGGTSAAQSTPWWLPLFTGIAGLLGTIVGGLITFSTTRFVHKQQVEADREREQRDAHAEREREKREAEAERERQRRKQVTDISIRFIQAVSKQASSNTGLKDTLAELKSKIEQAAQEANPLEAIAELTAQGSSQVPTSADVASQVGAASALLAGMGTAEPALSELTTLLAEMRLIVPNDIVYVAEQVSTVCFLAQSSAGLSLMPLRMRLSLGAMVTTALNVFVNAVRHEVGLDYYVPQKVEFKDVGIVLQKLADKQTNAASSS
jgi:hypothetical protein